MKPISTRTFDPVAIIRDTPPKLREHNLEIVYRIAEAENSQFAGPLVYSRWAEMPLPEQSPAGIRAMVSVAHDFFRYDTTESQDKTLCVWHLNFANYDLFSYYGSGLFAQDEMQVAEHPVLASLRESLVKEKLSTRTVENGCPTPILLRGVERRVRVATNPNAAEERPTGLYGNHFARAKMQAIRKATIKLNPATISNIIAIEAPPGGRGAYSGEQIRSILTTAYSGFRAAKLESAEVGREMKVVIHTGFWGCGAYGGNRALMSIIQLYAAKLAEIDHLAFHAGDGEGVRQFQAAQESLARFEPNAPATSAMIELLADQKFQWGMSDGN